jgi:DNA replication protein DnaC
MRDARKACDDLLEGKRHCVYLSAQTGRGKTHLAKATTVAWIERGKGSAVFRTVPDLMDELRQSFDSDAPWSLTERMKSYEKADLLVLDDLGAEKATDWVAERLFSLIDKRLGAGRTRPTFVTSNVRPDSDRIPMRIASRLAPGLVQIDGGVDFRQKQFTEPAPWAR